MGQIIIETPLHLDRQYRIISHDSAEEILLQLENSIEKSNAIGKEEISNIFAERQESADEIARETRLSWKRKLY